MIGEELVKGAVSVKNGWVPSSIKEKLIDRRAMRMIGGTGFAFVTEEIVRGNTVVIKCDILRIVGSDGFHTKSIDAESVIKTTINQRVGRGDRAGVRNIIAVQESRNVVNSGGWRGEEINGISMERKEGGFGIVNCSHTDRSRRGSRRVSGRQSIRGWLDNCPASMLSDRLGRRARRDTQFFSPT
jgi:hypothetical protein